VIALHKCLGCGVNVIKIGDYCNLSNEIWYGTLGLKADGNTCIACIEKRLGRPLRSCLQNPSLQNSDFAGYPWVEGYPLSDRLLEIYGGQAKAKAQAKVKAESKAQAKVKAESKAVMGEMRP
jgi:hypothetical protein